jgi:hypothetical protein
MSYSIHVWEAPCPSTFDEAVHIALDLGEEVMGQNPGFIVLAGRLKARYPCITRDPDSVWSDGPLDGKTDERAYVLGIRGRHEEVVDHIVKSAAKLGLTVFDMQSGIAYLPSGKALTKQSAAELTKKSAAAPAAPQCDGLNETEVRNAIYEGMMSVLGVFGFVHDRTDEHQLMLRFPGGSHRIGVPIVNRYPLYYEFTVLISTRLDQVATIAATLRGVSSDYIEKAHCSLVGYGYLYGDARKEYQVDSRAGLALAITEMTTVIANQLPPLLEKISDIGGMDALFNGSATDPSFQLHRDDGFNALTLARLAGNPEYPALCARYLSAVHPANRDLRWNLPRLIAYLDDYDADNPAPPSFVPSDEAERIIAGYDGSQLEAIRVKPYAGRGSAFADENEQFRMELMRKAESLMHNFSLRLVRDLFRAEAITCTAYDNFQRTTFANLSHALLSRGGVDELALFAECMPEAGLGAQRIKELPLAADIAESLRLACAERTTNPMFAARAVQYATLERYFAAVATRGHA